MISFVLASYLAVCPAPKMLNITKYPWNDYDRETFKRALVHCKELYPKSPCVKLFRKWGEKDYSVICGK